MGDVQPLGMAFTKQNPEVKCPPQSGPRILLDIKRVHVCGKSSFKSSMHFLYPGDKPCHSTRWLKSRAGEVMGDTIPCTSVVMCENINFIVMIDSWVGNGRQRLPHVLVIVSVLC